MVCHLWQRPKSFLPMTVCAFKQNIKVSSSFANRSSHSHHFRYSATVMRCLCFQTACLYAFALSKGLHGIFNVRNDFNVWCAYEGDTGTDECLYMPTRKDWKKSPTTTPHPHHHPPPPPPPAAIRSRTLSLGFRVQCISQRAANSLQAPVRHLIIWNVSG